MGELSCDELARMAACPWLTDRQRKIFELRYRRGWHIEDIAAELFIARSTVDRELARIRKKTL